MSPLAGLDFQNPRIPSHYSTVSGKNLVFPLSCSWCETLPRFATFSEDKTDFPSHSLLRHLATISRGSHIFVGDVSNNLDFSLLLLFLGNLRATLPQGHKAECELVIPVCVSPSQNGLLSGQPDGSRSKIRFFLPCHSQHLSPPHPLSSKHRPGSCITPVQNSNTNQCTTQALRRSQIILC